MFGVTPVACCGIKELNGLGPAMGIHDPDKPGGINTCLKDLAEKFAQKQLRNAFFIFSGVKPAKYDHEFATLILDNKLGDVVNSPTRKNPNSGNQLTAWIWTVDHEGLREWYKRQYKAYPKTPEDIQLEQANAYAAAQQAARERETATIEVAKVARKAKPAI